LTFASVLLYFSLYCAALFVIKTSLFLQVLARIEPLVENAIKNPDWESLILASRTDHVPAQRNKDDQEL
jgi:hypothetical protein